MSNNNVNEEKSIWFEAQKSILYDNLLLVFLFFVWKMKIFLPVAV
jgi:hypothetical protein